MTKKSKGKKPQRRKKSSPKKNSVSFKLPAIVEQYGAWIALGFLALFILIVRWNLLSIPMERDEGIYAYFGQLVLEGKTPYLDFHEFKFPGIYYAYAILVAIFGKTVEGLHVAFLLLNLATVYFLFAIGKKMFNAFTGVLTATSYALLSLGYRTQGFTVQSEHLITFFVAVGIYLLLKYFEGKKVWAVVFAGVCLCLSFLIKSNGVFFILFGGLFLVSYHFFQKEKDWKLLIKSVLLYSAGVFGTFGVVCAAMAMQGALGAMFYWTVEAPKNYLTAMSFSQGMTQFSNLFSLIVPSYWPFWLLAALSLIGIWASSVERYIKVGLFTFALLSFLAITPGLHFYAHYWIMLMPCIALLFGAFFYILNEKLQPVLGHSTFLTLVGVAVLLVIFNIQQNRSYYFSPDYKRILREAYGMSPFYEDMEIANFLNKRKKEGDQMMLFGSEPQLYVYTDMRCPSKHAYFSYLMYDKEDPMVAQAIKEFKQDIEKANPRFLVVFKNKFSILPRKNSDMTLYNWLGGLVQQRQYRRIGIVDMVDVLDTKYLWEGDAGLLDYVPKSEYWVEVFERP